MRVTSRLPWQPVVLAHAIRPSRPSTCSEHWSVLCIEEYPALRRPGSETEGLEEQEVSVIQFSRRCAPTATAQYSLSAKADENG